MRYEDSSEGLAQFKDISLAGNVAKVRLTANSVTVFDGSCEPIVLIVWHQQRGLASL